MRYTGLAACDFYPKFYGVNLPTDVTAAAAAAAVIISDCLQSRINVVFSLYNVII